ncbi:S-layer homology domain-containing protein [Paenibacillus sp. D2_2]|uniref:S-layer homology domain-containing protein n=1 Tax=Paenibacillus sp. D2_2 TaxID=3073092 RepID=UPI002815491C|nr:S-layer homology domain-containing protein [Paenibacillus sp. D2_2]WMT42750.1 S-layer homology domain-containing protein [Paenibacillus sp. D2_2]
MSSYKRKFQRNMNKAVSTMLVTALCLGGGAAAFADGVQGEASQSQTQNTSSFQLFSDVKSGFWAEKHIYKLASEGIILGDAGKFRPGDSVTQQEAITMAIRFMNLDSKLGSGENTPKELVVGNYFKPYVELALQQKLIDKTEEITSTKEKEEWGKKPASREWIAKILVRALDKEAEAKAAAGTSTGFADESSISASARGYVNVAVQLDLTKGVEGNKFDPRGNVTRAQLATFFSRGGDHVNPGYDNVYEGIVTSLKDDSLTLFVNGTTRTFKLDNRSVYFTKDSETSVSKAALQLYTKVLVVDKIGSAAYVEVRDASQQLEKTEGTLLRVLSGNRLLLLVNNDSVTYTYDNNTMFLDQNGNNIGADNLTPDSTVEIQRETFTAEKKPIIVQVKSAIVNKSGSGVVEDFDLTKKTIKIKEASGLEETFKYDDNTIVLYQDQLLNNPGELQKGAAVEFTVKNNVLTKIEVTQGIERTVTGTLLSIEGKSLISFMNTNGKDEIKRLVEKPLIVINGIADATLDDLIADVKGGDKVKLTINPEEQVTKIEVTGRQSESVSAVSVVKYEPKLKALMVVDSAKKVHAFTLDEKTKVEYNSATPTLAGAEALLTEGRKINLTYIGDRVLSLQVIYKYDGTYVSTDTSKKQVTILQADGTKIDVPYQGTAPSISMYGKSNPGLSDLKAGDPVTVILSANQDALQTLAVKKTVQFEITNVTTSNSRIRAVANGISDEFYVDQATLFGDNGIAIKINDLKVGQTINVSFSGRTATSLQVVKLSLGKVDQVDGSVLKLKKFDGTSETFPLGSGVKVVRNGVVSSSSSLNTSDHVEVRKDTDGSLLVKVLSSMERQVSRYNTLTSELSVLRSSVADNNYRFSITDDIYIHQGDTTLSVQSLKENDKIVLYFNGDKLIEIEKQ